MVKIWRDKEGKWLTPREFMERFKKGVSQVTPLQQTQSQLLFTYLTLIGIVCGLIVSIIKLSSLWWLGIILLAGLGNTIVGWIATYQKYLALRKVEEMFEDGNH